jgi:hypothetical protein
MREEENAKEKETTMVFETLDDLQHYIINAEPDTIDGFRVVGELFEELRSCADRARSGWWPNCQAFGCMEEYCGGEGEYLEIDENGIIVNSSVYF